MKYIIISLMLIITGCTTTNQKISPVDVEKRQTYQTTHYKIPCNYGKCQCDKRLLEMEDCFDDSNPYFKYYELIR